MLRAADWYAGSQISRHPHTSFARRLRLCRCRSRRLRGWSFLVLKIDLGSLSRAFVCLEVRVIPGKAAQARYQAAREKGNIGGVVLHRFIVTTPLHGDSVLCARQLVLKPQKVFVGF